MRDQFIETRFLRTFCDVLLMKDGVPNVEMSIVYFMAYDCDVLLIEDGVPVLKYLLYGLLFLSCKLYRYTSELLNWKNILYAFLRIEKFISHQLNSLQCTGGYLPPTPPQSGHHFCSLVLSCWKNVEVSLL
jgi:hypothetical protein